MPVHSLSPAAWAVLVALIPTAAPAASFDCGKVRSGTERLICSDAGLGARDEIMATIYASALRKDAGGRVRAEQREWLAKAEACGTAACLAAAYDARIGVLLGTEGGNAVATHLFTEAPAGHHGTLDVVGPVDGVVAVLLTSTFVGPRGADAGDVNAASISAVLDLRRVPAETTERGCTVAFRRVDADRWQVEQHGSCVTPDGTGFAGTYKR